MKELDFERAEYLLSALDKKDFPSIKNDNGQPYFEIVISGRSNVGKSSLINHLLNTKNLAYTSSTPGKTRTINFYKVDDEFLLLDFPGYGYAKGPQKLKEQWAKNFEIFFNERPTIKLLLLLIDSRRVPSYDDILFYQWAEGKNIPCLVIATKCDKLKKAEIEKSLKSIEQIIQDSCHSSTFFCVPYSINDSNGKKILRAKIKSLLGKI